MRPVNLESAKQRRLERHRESIMRELGSLSSEQLEKIIMVFPHEKGVVTFDGETEPAILRCLGELEMAKIGLLSSLANVRGER